MLSKTVYLTRGAVCSALILGNRDFCYGRNRDLVTPVDRSDITLLPCRSSWSPEQHSSSASVPARNHLPPSAPPCQRRHLSPAARGPAPLRRRRHPRTICGKRRTRPAPTRAARASACARRARPTRTASRPQRPSCATTMTSISTSIWTPRRPLTSSSTAGPTRPPSTTAFLSRITPTWATRTSTMMT